MVRFSSLVRGGLIGLTLLLAWYCLANLPSPARAGADEPTPAPGEEEELGGAVPARRQSTPAWARKTPNPYRTPSSVDRLAQKTMVPNPSQVQHGEYMYYQVCMACHGDRGQGLTEEWRAEWEEDAYCWASECHGNNHPPQGFSFPQTCCKAVIGPDTLLTYKDGLELFTYISTTMPWWNPGYLKLDEFWAITAYLMSAHNALPKGVELGAGNAAVFHLRPQAPFPGDTRPQVLFVVTVLGLAAGLIFVQNKRK